MALDAPDLNSSEEIGGNENTKVYIWEEEIIALFLMEILSNKYSD